ncbi:MAG TPA: TSUP family transporter [Chitinophagaceae bacterium]|nr:TSUP family transporter [Chitinophagaceae bacterium]
MSKQEAAASISLEEAIKTGRNRLFPVFLKLEELRVLLVGGGNVALEKLNALLQNAPGASIWVVGTTINEGIKTLAAQYPAVVLDERPFADSDIDEKEVVIVAVNDRTVSSYVRMLAKEKKLLVNVADTPDQCDFYLGAIVQKGDLKIAISTNGKSPTIAKRMREQLNELIPDEINGVLDNMQLIRQDLKGDFARKVKQLDTITKGLAANTATVEDEEEESAGKPEQKKWRKLATYSLLAFGFMILGHILFSFITVPDITGGVRNIYSQLDKNFHWMVLAGFLAQLVDGALGMGYGVTSAAILLSTGINPAAISGSIHTAEMFASGASGYSHYKFGNVNKKLFKILVIPGVIGAIAGALLLVFLGEKYSAYIRPILASYTLFLGVKILLNAFIKMKQTKKFKRYGALAGLGGFLDSFGGGGWGPIVTTTLITKGRSPRFVIGTVSLTEFFVTLASAFSFFILLGVTHIQTIIALIIGGFVAAPLAAKLAGRLPRKTSFMLLGVLVIVWSLKILSRLL